MSEDKVTDLAPKLLVLILAVREETGQHGPWQVTASMLGWQVGKAVPIAVFKTEAEATIVRDALNGQARFETELARRWAASITEVMDELWNQPSLMNSVNRGVVIEAALAAARRGVSP